MRAILTRHYRTILNAKGRIVGWGDSPPHHSCKPDMDFIGKRLRSEVDKFDAVYSSDLERARQTAKTYAQSYGIAELTSVSELREINYGDLQTRKKSWVHKQFPEHKKVPGFVYPAGESFLQVQQRSVHYLTSLVREHPDKTVLIVSHAGVIRALISHFLDLEYAASLKFKIPYRYIGDFRFEQGKFASYNELGNASGFVRDGVIDVPFVADLSATPSVCR